MKCRNTRGRCKKLRAGWLLELDEVRNPGLEEGLSSRPHWEGQSGTEDHVRTGVTQGQNHPQSHTSQPPAGTGHSRAGQATGDWKAPWPPARAAEATVMAPST